MRLVRFDFKKIKNFFKKLPKSLVERSFLTLVLILLFDLIIFFILYFNSKLKIERPAQIERVINFDEKTYKRVLETWKERERKFQEIDSKVYQSPFK